MANAINALFQFLENRFGLVPTGVATIAMFAFLVAVVLAFLIFGRLRRSRKYIEVLAERLGYEPPYGDGEEVVHEEVRKNIVQRGKELKFEQLETRIGELEAEGQQKEATFAASRKHSQELEEQLRQAALQNDSAEAQLGSQAKAHRAAIEQLEQRMRDSEAENNSNLTALHNQAKDLEEKLQQAFLRNDKVVALANEQAQGHERAVEQFDQRVREIEAENESKLTAVQRRSMELEDQLRKTTQNNEEVLTQAAAQLQEHRDTIVRLEGRIRQSEGENEASLTAAQQRARQFEDQARDALRQKDSVLAQAEEVTKAHRETVSQLEDHIRLVENENRVNVNGLQQRTRELEEQLQQVYKQRDQVMAQASDQAQALREALTQAEQRIHEIEGQSNADLNALGQRSKQLEEQLQQAVIHRERITAQAGEQARLHEETVTKLEGYIRKMEGESKQRIVAHEQVTRDLEEKLEQAVQHHERIAVEAGAQAQTHREKVAHLEGRVRQVEGESAANLNAIQLYARDLEEQLRQATLLHEKVAAQAGEQARKHVETVAQLEGRIRQVEGESSTNLNALQQRARDLEDQLQQATLNHEKAAAQAGEQVKAHREMVAQLEGRVQQVEGESAANLNVIQQHARELEEQLGQATLLHEKTAAQAGAQAQAHRETVAKLEGRIRQVEGESNTNLNAIQQHARDLEEQLGQAALLHEKTAAQAGEQAQAHRETVAKLEGRIRQVEGESNANLNALQQHARDLEEQLGQAALLHEKTAAQAGAQAQAHRETVAQLEGRIRQVEGESNANLNALQQHAGDLEDQLRQVTLRHEKTAAQAGEQARQHAEAVAQFEARIRQIVGESNANLGALEHRAGDLEEQLRQATLRHEKTAAQAGEQAQTHRETVAQLEGRIRQVEGESGANLNALQLHAGDLEEQLRQTTLRHEKTAAQAGEQARLHTEMVAQLEGRIRQIEGESNANQNALQQHAGELEEQLRQATLRNEKTAMQAGEQVRQHLEMVAQLEGRIREVEGESNANLSALQQHAGDLEEQLRQATLRHEKTAAQAGEQARMHAEAVAQLDARIRQVEGESSTNLTALQQHAKELEEQLGQSALDHERIAAQAGEQVRKHGEKVAQLEGRIHQIEDESSANLSTLQQHAGDLEEQLGQATLHHGRLVAHAGEQARLHGETVAELEGRIHQMEGEKNEILSALEQRTKDLEEQLEKATIRNDQVLSQAAEQIQAYRLTVEKLEERIHATEIEGNANLTALEQRSTDLEEQLRHAATQYENEKSAARQLMLDRTAGLEQVTARVRVLEAAAKAKDSHLATLQAQIEQLESELQQAPGWVEPEVTKMTTGEGTAEALMRRADWIVSHAVGTVLPHGLVAAEVYASAALAASPRDAGAQQLLAELARIRRAYPDGLPSITEAVTGFDERAAAFFAADPARAADIAEEEAQRRFRAGLNRSALLMTNTALELRQHAGAMDGAETERLQEMKSSLLSRLG